MLEKEKAKYAKEIENLRSGFAQDLEHYRAQLDRSIFVTRAHFETEFTAMKEVSQCLSAVKIAVRGLYPIEFRAPGIIDIERGKQVAELQSANQKFREKLEEWAVFLEPALYDEFDHCQAGAEALCGEEKTLDGHPRPGSKTYFWDSYRKACQLVRDRIKGLAVMPRT
jgi:hypothetical protein